MDSLVYYYCAGAMQCSSTWCTTFSLFFNLGQQTHTHSLSLFSKSTLAHSVILHSLVRLIERPERGIKRISHPNCIWLAGKLERESLLLCVCVYCSTKPILDIRESNDLSLNSHKADSFTRKIFNKIWNWLALTLLCFLETNALWSIVILDKNRVTPCEPPFHFHFFISISLEQYTTKTVSLIQKSNATLSPVFSKYLALF